MKKYQPKDFEQKWQKKWAEDKIYQTDLSNDKNKYYCLVELAYTSGTLHMGHWFTFTKGDILARFKLMQDYNVVFPNGYDTFGLPAENAAIKNNMHPREWTYKNISKMREQFETMGTMIDWTKSVITCEPEYYKWNQWIFLKMLEKDVAFKGQTISNWCPVCQTVLADENVEAGKCWRCGSEVEKKEVEQWFLRITKYADDLIWQDDGKYDWPKSLKDAQNKWIGKSIGTEIEFRIEDSESRIRVFTVYPETIFGVTYLVLAPEHPLILEITTYDQKTEIEKYVKQSQKKSEQERKEGEKQKTGVFTGAYVINPVNDKKVPLWVADYVIGGYGTGAVMGVPGSDHRDFEFAQKYDLEIIRVIGKDKNDTGSVDDIEEVLEEGVLVNSEQFSGLNTPNPAKEQLIEFLVKEGYAERRVQYHLHDWSISRQRYWGTPIPVIYCDDCGTVPVPYEDLPVVLPEEVDYTPKGDAPLSRALDWVNVKCPRCGKDAKREVETMDGFIDNSWYFYRYLDPNNDQEIFNKKLIADWMPIEIYIGGAEHTYGHALYSRFFSKFFKDIGLVDFDEYNQKRIHHGVILGPDGNRMSKSKGNVVDPDIEAEKFGADSIRVYLSFMGPYDIVSAWVPEGLNGIYHFLQRVWGLYDKISDQDPQAESLTMMHKTIKKVTTDLNELSNNTAIAALMEWLNFLSRQDSISKQEYHAYLKLLAPLAPHITEELWQMLGEKDSIHLQEWPKVEEKYLEEDEFTIVIQINGKVRDQIKVSKEETEEGVKQKALFSEKVQKFIEGKDIKKSIYIPGKILNLVS